MTAVPAIADAISKIFLITSNPFTNSTFKTTTLIIASIISSIVIFSLKFPTALKNPIITKKFRLIIPMDKAHGYNSLFT